VNQSSSPQSDGLDDVDLEERRDIPFSAQLEPDGDGVARVPAGDARPSGSATGVPLAWPRPPSTRVVIEIVSRERRAPVLAASIASWSALAASGNRQILDVVTGRVEADESELRRESLAENGDLTRAIHHFVAQRSKSLGRSAQ
jgi:hypothetical protein